MAEAESTADQDEWSRTFAIQVRYEVQVTRRMVGWLREMREDGYTEADLADEIGGRIAMRDADVNVVDSDAEFWLDSSDLLERGIG